MAETDDLYYKSTNREAEIKRVFDRYYRPLVLFACEYVNDIEVSKDIVQDFFCSLWKKDYLSQVAEDKISSYLFTAVRNACAKYLLKKDPLRGSCPILDLDFVSGWQDTVDDESLRKARMILDKMPPRTREAMEYVMMKDYTYKAAAEAMGISVNTVKFLLKDGTRKAREQKSVLLSLSVLLFKLLYAAGSAVPPHYNCFF